MEDYNFQNRPNTKPERPQNLKVRYTFWGIWGPVIINWLISAAVGLVAIFALTSVYVTEHQDLVMKIFEDEAIKEQISEVLINQYLDYSTIIQGVASLVGIPLMFKFFKRDRKRLQGFEPEYKKLDTMIYISSAVMFLMAGFIMNSYIIISHFTEMSETYETTMVSYYTAPLALQIIFLGLIVPICEELVFRGLVYKRFRAYEKFAKSAIGSAIIFAVVHGNFVQCIYAFALGLLLAFVYEKTGSLKIPILGHMIMNIFAIMATEWKLYEFLSKDFVYIAACTVFATAIAATMYIYIKDTEYMIVEVKEEEE